MVSLDDLGEALKKGEVDDSFESKVRWFEKKKKEEEEKQKIKEEEKKEEPTENNETDNEDDIPPTQNENNANTDNNNNNERITILDIFPISELTQTSSGYKTECPDCGLQGGRTEGFIIFPESNQAFCHSSGKHFKMLEAYALKKKIIRCLDGREKGDSQSKILGGELFTLTLEEFKNEFGTDTYNTLITQLNIRKSVELPSNDNLMSDFADELGDVYKSRNVLFFRGESRDVVEIRKYKKINKDKEENSEQGFVTVDANRFITLAEMFIRPWTTVYALNGTSRIVSKSMTNSMASIAISSPNFQNKIPIISRIFDIQIPILYKGTLTFPKKGYDIRFGSWLPYNAPQIKKGMFTLDEAIKIIDKIFEEFCFESEKDRTHAISAFITPFLRGLFPKFSTRTPVFIYMANRERAGKDYCAGCSGILYEGSNIEEPAISNDEKGNSNANEELRKKIMACMIQGKKRFHSANNKGLLNNAILEGVTTSEEWSDRILGRSQNIKFSNEMDYSLSGNLGIRLTPDLANRARIINLHLMDEDANARIFKNPNLHEFILENRSMIISAIYKLVETWFEKGMLKGTVPFTSFPAWASICGGIMECAGYNNPCKKDESAVISLDSETEEMKLLFEACYQKYPKVPINKKEIQEVVESENLMPSLDFSNRSDQIKFGLKIDKFSNRILSEILMKVESFNVRTARRRFIFSKKGENNELVMLVGLGNVSTSINGLHSEPWTGVSTLPKVTNITKFKRTFDKMVMSGNDSNIDSKNEQVNSKIEKTPNLVKNDEKTVPERLEDFAKKSQEFLKKEAEFEQKKSQKVRPKTDRELQFWEAPECAKITENCTKKQVLEWINANSKNSLKMMDETLGLGCWKHLGTLIDEGKVRKVDDGVEIC